MPHDMFRASRPALLHGYHRSFCMYSWHYRGTEEAPGLVLGLDVGGSCRGLAFRVAGARAEAVFAYLHEREMVYHIYLPKDLKVQLPDGRAVRARSYVADRRAALNSASSRRRPTNPSEGAKFVERGVAS